MICDVCGSTGFHSAEVARTFTVEGKLVVVEGIPAEVCDRCDAPSFTADVAERLRRLVHEPHQPDRIIQAEVLHFHAA
ncbi:MAG: YgiT-type zinc finger protein [bacterium]|nr:YgiT-type zinc finger protein [bacterium]